MFLLMFMWICCDTLQCTIQKCYVQKNQSILFLWTVMTVATVSTGSYSMAYKEIIYKNFFMSTRWHYSGYQMKKIEFCYLCALKILRIVLAYWNMKSQRWSFGFNIFAFFSISLILRNFSRRNLFFLDPIWARREYAVITVSAGTAFRIFTAFIVGNRTATGK